MGTDRWLPLTIFFILVTLLTAVTATVSNCSVAYNATDPLILKSNEDYMFAHCPQAVFIALTTNITNATLHIHYTALGSPLQIQAPLENISIELRGVMLSTLPSTPMTLIVAAVSSASSTLARVSVLVFNDVMTFSVAPPWPSLIVFPAGLSCVQCRIVLRNMTISAGNEYFLTLQANFTRLSLIWLTEFVWYSAARSALLNPCIHVSQLTDESELVISNALVVGTYDSWLTTTAVSSGSRVTLANATTRQFSVVLLNQAASMTGSVVVISNVTDDSSFQVLLVINAILSDMTIEVSNCTFSASNNAPICIQSCILTNLAMAMLQLTCINSLCVYLRSNTNAINTSLTLQDITFYGGSRAVDWFGSTWTGLSVRAKQVIGTDCAGVSWLRCHGVGEDTRVVITDSIVASQTFVAKSAMNHIELYSINTTWCAPSTQSAGGISFGGDTSAAPPILFSDVLVSLEDCILQPNSFSSLSLSADIARNVTFQLIRVDASAWLPLDNATRGTVIVGVTAFGTAVSNASIGTAIAIIDSVMGGHVSIFNIYPVAISIVNSIVFCGPVHAFEVFYNTSSAVSLDSSGSNAPTIPQLRWDGSQLMSALWFQQVTAIGVSTGVLLRFDADVALKTQQWNVSVTFGNGTSRLGDIAIFVIFFKVSIFSFQLAVLGTNSLHYDGAVAVLFVDVVFFLPTRNISSPAAQPEDSPWILAEVHNATSTSGSWLAFHNSTFISSSGEPAALMVSIVVQESSIVGSLVIIEHCNITMLQVAIQVVDCTWTLKDIAVALLHSVIDRHGATSINMTIVRTNLTLLGSQPQSLVTLSDVAEGTWLPLPTSNTTTTPLSWMYVEVTLRRSTLMCGAPTIVFCAYNVAPAWTTQLTKTPLEVHVRFIEQSSWILVPSSAPKLLNVNSLTNLSTFVVASISVLQSVHIDIDGASNVTADNILAVWSCDVLGDIRVSLRGGSATHLTTPTSWNLVDVRSALQRDVSLITQLKASWLVQIDGDSTLFVGLLFSAAVRIYFSTLPSLGSLIISVSGGATVSAPNGLVDITRTALTGVGTAPSALVLITVNESSSIIGSGMPVVSTYRSNLFNLLISIGDSSSGHASTSIFNSSIFSAVLCYCPGMQWALTLRNAVIILERDVTGGTTYYLCNFASNNFPNKGALIPSLLWDAESSTLHTSGVTSWLYVRNDNVLSSSVIPLNVSFQRCHMIATVRLTLTPIDELVLALISIHPTLMNVSSTILFFASNVSLTTNLAAATRNITSNANISVILSLLYVERDVCQSSPIVSVSQCTISIATDINGTNATPPRLNSILSLVEAQTNLCSDDGNVASPPVYVTLVGTELVVPPSFYSVVALTLRSTTGSRGTNYSIDFDGGGITSSGMKLLSVVVDGPSNASTNATMVVRCVEELPASSPRRYVNGSAAVLGDVSVEMYDHTLLSVPSTRCGSLTAAVSESQSGIESPSALSPTPSGAQSFSIPTASSFPSNTESVPSPSLLASKSASLSSVSLATLWKTPTKLTSQLSVSVSISTSSSRSVTGGWSTQTHTLTPTRSRGPTHTLSLHATRSSSRSPSPPSNSDTTSLNNSASYVLVESPTLTQRPLVNAGVSILPKPVRDSISGASVVSGMVGTGVVGPATAMNAYRGMTQLALIACPSQDDALENFNGDWSLNPLLLAIGVDRLQFARGAAVGDLILMGALTVLGLLSVVIRRHFLGRSSVATYWSAAGRLQFPGLLLIPYTMLLQPLVMMNLIIIGLGDAGDVVLGVATLMICVVVPLTLCWYLLLLNFSATARFAADHDVQYEEDSLLRTRLGSLIYFWFHQAYHWVSQDTFPTFVSCFGFLFDPYVAHRHWFLLVELGSGCITGAVGAAQVLGMSCSALTEVLVGFAALYILLLMFLRPLDSNLEAFLAHVNGWATLVSSILALFDDTESAAAWIIAGQLWLSMAMIALAIVQYAHAKYLDGEKRKRQRQHGRSDSFESLGGAVMLRDVNSDDDNFGNGEVVHELFPADPMANEATEAVCADEVGHHFDEVLEECSPTQVRATKLLWMPSDPTVRMRYEKLKGDLSNLL
ncbi:transmembrane protein, putative [Bodo saltans]|uniref:Transmembrane protein, putative n=1 Tax=Bodo saltans TaxID=75058 RepID=A0A0S4J018_BODSA|nr:transmembrane protein, putative [Bodo saltans]|eukprot:CUG27692.1 transmembrane protein, putative [Bodo saltans]